MKNIFMRMVIAGYMFAGILFSSPNFEHTHTKPTLTVKDTIYQDTSHLSLKEKWLLAGDTTKYKLIDKGGVWLIEEK